jgi:hypothetical protein
MMNHCAMQTRTMMKNINKAVIFQCQTPFILFHATREQQMLYLLNEGGSYTSG